MYKLLRDAVLKADASKHTLDDIEERASRETIMPMIKSAIAKFGEIKSISSPNLIRGIAHAAPQNVSLTSKEELIAEIKNFFNF